MREDDGSSITYSTTFVFMKKVNVIAAAVAALTIAALPHVKSAAAIAPAQGSNLGKQVTQSVTITVSGQVVDQSGEPIIGATVSVKEVKGKGTGTDLDGYFTLEGVPSDATLVISYVGMKTQEVPLNGQSSLKIVLHDNSELLDELVVVGFGSQKKVDLTGAVSQVEMSKVLGDRPIVSASAALQGAIPGLFVSGASGPGQAKNFNIRGDLSINGGNPLVLIDNVEGDINALNPNDIESISVLKDASSAAIYGARAAGGVILVTTKRPKSGTRFEATYNFSQGWERSISRPVQASLDDYIAAYEEAGFSKQYWEGNGDITKWKEYLAQYRAGTLEGVQDNGIYRDGDKVYYLKEGDVLGNALGTGVLSNHNVSVSGATDKLRFRLSGGYANDDGPMVTDKDSFRRLTLSSFVAADINSWLTTEVNVHYTSKARTSLATSIRDPFAVRLINWYPEGYMPKEIIGQDEDLIIDTPRNTYLVSPTQINDVSIPRIQSKVIIKPLKNWDINVEYTFSRIDTKTNGYSNVIKYADVQLAVKTAPTNPTRDAYWINTSIEKYHALNVFSNYKFDLDNHHIGVMLGYNQESNWWGGVNATIEGQSLPAVPSFGGGTGTKTLSDNYSEYAIRGAFGRLTYNYADRYLLTVNARYDGSSKFPKVNRFGFFPSISAGWRVAEESFMEWSRSWLDNFKIRASYGTIGNQNIAPYGFVPSMSIGESNVWLDQNKKVTIIGAPGLVRNNYTWEKVNTFDAGFDLDAFNRRLNVAFSWYLRTTEGMLAPGAEIPATVGAAAPLQNIADMQTKGWEIGINWQDYVGDFSYRVGVNLYDYMSEITKYNNLSGNLNAYYVGRKMNEIWGYVSDGFYSIDDFDLDKARQDVWQLKDGIASINGATVKPGDAKFKDLDGNGIINGGANTLSDSGDMKIIGNSTNRFQYGVNLGAGWKGLDLSVMLQGVGKRDVWLPGVALFPFAAAGSDGVFWPVYSNQTDYWRAKSYDPASPDYMVAANPNAKLFRIYGQMQNSGSSARTSTGYLQSGAYMRVKNITLSYSLPKEWINKIQLSQMRLYVSVENPATITSLPKGYDPENLKWAYPFYRTWSFGANITL